MLKTTTDMEIALTRTTGVGTRALRRGILVAGLVALIGGSATAQETRLGIVVETLANPFFACLKSSAEAEAAKHPEVKLTVIGAATGTDLVGMTRMVQDLLQKGVDVISFNAIDPNAMIQTVKDAQAKGVKVILESDDTAKQVADHYVGNDQQATQSAITKVLINAIGGKGNVAILEGVPGNMTNLMRKEGAQKTLAQYPDIKVVGTWSADWDRAKGLQKAQDILTAHPDLNGIVAFNDEMALGAVQAIRAAGLQGKVAVTGANGAPEALKAVAVGDMSGTVITYCSDIGEQIVKTALTITKPGSEKLPYAVATRYDVVDTLLMSFITQRLAK